MKTERQFSSQACRLAGFPAMLFIAGALTFASVNAPAAAALPTASEVTARILKRAQEVAQAEDNPQYTYQKRSLMEHLNAAGHATESEERLYEVRLINGCPFNRLVKVQGHDLTAAELKHQEEREERFRQRFVNADRKKLVAQKEALVTPELLNRYVFEVKGRIVLSNRSTLVLTFKPKSGDLPSGTVQDELLKRMAGTLWIDEEDAEAARIAVNMIEPFSLGFLGWMGALNQFELTLDRQRMPDGVWVNTRMIMLIQCRKVISTLRFRTTEESSGFKHVEAGR